MSNSPTKYIAIEKGSRYVPGDARSVSAPGHGYPEHYEETNEVHRFASMELLKQFLSKNKDSLSTMEIFEVKALKPSISIDITIK